MDRRYIGHVPRNKTEFENLLHDALINLDYVKEHTPQEMFPLFEVQFIDGKYRVYPSLLSYQIYFDFDTEEEAYSSLTGQLFMILKNMSRLSSYLDDHTYLSNSFRYVDTVSSSMNLPSDESVEVLESIARNTDLMLEFKAICTIPNLPMDKMIRIHAYSAEDVADMLNLNQIESYTFMAYLYNYPEEGLAVLESDLIF